MYCYGLKTEKVCGVSTVVVVRSVISGLRVSYIMSGLVKSADGKNLVLFNV